MESLHTWPDNLTPDLLFKHANRLRWECFQSYLSGSVRQPVVLVLKEAVSVFGQTLDHLQAGEIIGSAESTDACLLESRRQRKQILQSTTPRHHTHTLNTWLQGWMKSVCVKQSRDHTLLHSAHLNQLAPLLHTLNACECVWKREREGCVYEPLPMWRQRVGVASSIYRQRVGVAVWLCPYIAEEVDVWIHIYRKEVGVAFWLHLQKAGNRHENIYSVQKFRERANLW